MRSIKKEGASSTEKRLRAILVRNGIRGWRYHPKGMHGNPDFAFTDKRVAIFVDGAFWHGHPSMCRMPKSNVEYWRRKIACNRLRDKGVSRTLRGLGWGVIRIWDVDLQKSSAHVLGVIKRKLQNQFQLPLLLNGTCGSQMRRLPVPAAVPIRQPAPPDSNSNRSPIRR